MTWVKFIFTRNLLAYAALGAVFVFAINHAKVEDQRYRYLLGIYYNGHFKNYKDGIVYFDYMVRQQPNDPKHYADLARCYKELGDEKRAAKYRQRSGQ